MPLCALIHAERRADADCGGTAHGKTANGIAQRFDVVKIQNFLLRGEKGLVDERNFIVLRQPNGVRQGMRMLGGFVHFAVLSVLSNENK